MSTIKISVARVSDLEHLKQIRLKSQSQFADDKDDLSDAKAFNMLQKRRYGKIFIASIDDVVVGSVACVDHPFDRRICWVYRLLVDDGNTRKGVASDLMRRVEDHAKSQGAKFIMLSIVDNNEAARSLYTRLGYLEDGYVSYSTHTECKFVKNI